MGKELIKLPECYEHGQMLLRPKEHQTYEQAWCGTWYDCGKCCNSVLYPSKELTEFLNEQKPEER